MLDKPESNLEKRLKRRIYARKHEFFAIFPPGFEDIVEKELLCNFNIVAKKEVPFEKTAKGGILFEAEMIDCYKINLFSRSLTRLLLRICSFKALYFSELRIAISKVQWELYLNPARAIDINITVHNSKLYHTDRINLEIQKGISRRFAQYYNSQNSPELSFMKGEQTLFVRAEDNRFTLSLDTTGEPLYKRGYKTLTAKAPLRENLAYLILKSANFENCGFLLDPMTGSGTFAIEALLCANAMTPGAMRNFAFFMQPGFRKKAFYHLVEKGFCNMKFDLQVFASDIDAKNISIIRENAAKAGVNLKPECRNFFDLEPDKFPKSGLIMLNPPYGKRLEDKRDIELLYKKIFSKINNDFPLYNFAVIVPEEISLQKFSIENCKVMRFKNGGLRVNLVIKK